LAGYRGHLVEAIGYVELDKVHSPERWVAVVDSVEDTGKGVAELHHVLGEEFLGVLVDFIPRVVDEEARSPVAFGLHGGGDSLRFSRSLTNS
jgi:hypothetical protein